VRTSIDRELTRLCGEIATSVEELAHVDPSRILFVAGAARLDARASIRPLTFGGSPPSLRSGGYEKPAIRVFGADILYEICLRPRFFLDTPPVDRIGIIVHELWHTSKAFDGTLDPDRRHDRCPSAAIAGDVAGIVDRWIARGVPAVGAFLSSMSGEHEMWAWLHRPPSRIPIRSTIRRSYDERDLYRAIVRAVV
jgi:hypothetical protein